MINSVKVRGRVKEIYAALRSQRFHLSAVALAKVERLAPRHQQNLPEQTVTVFATLSQIHLLILPFYF